MEVRKFSERVNVKPSRIVRRLIALDETCVKVNGLEYWVYAALDVDRNEIISMRVYPSRNALASEQFIREVLKCCEGKPTFIMRHGLSRPWRSWSYHAMRSPFGDRSLIESVYSSFKQRRKVFFNNIEPNKQKREIQKANSLEPTNKTIHTILQPHEEVNLSCHVLSIEFLESLKTPLSKAEKLNHP